jgi:hypothetical protein
MRAARTAANDVKAIVKTCSRVTDDEVIGVAVGGNRVLLTEDKDFGIIGHLRPRHLVMLNTGRASRWSSAALSV